MNVNPIVFLIAGAAALAILLIAFALGRRGDSSGMAERLERYTTVLQEQGKSGSGLQDLIAQSVVLGQLEKQVERKDFAASISSDIARADLRLKVSEYIAIWAASTVGVPVIMVFFSLAIPTLRFPLFLLVGAFIGFLIPRMWIGRRKSGRLKSFNKQLPDTITLIGNALRAGSSFLQAIELVVREAQPPISTEFARVIREVNLGLPFEEALQNMVRRVKSEDLELLTTAISIQHQVGGNLAEILDSIAFTIRERVRIKGEIATLTAQQRLSAIVVGMLPVGLIAFLTIFEPSFMAPMLMNPPGIAGIPVGVILLSIGGFNMLIGFLILRKIIDIKV